MLKADPSGRAWYGFAFRTDGRTKLREKDYEGVHSRRMRWETVLEKFDLLTAGLDAGLRGELVDDAVSHRDEIPVAALTQLLENL